MLVVRVLKKLCIFVLFAILVVSFTSDALAQTSWNPPVVPSPGTEGRYTSLKVVNGKPAIGFFNGHLAYVHATDTKGDSWGNVITIAGAPGFISDISLAVVNGNPAMTYHSSFDDKLWYVRATDPNGDTWGTPVIAQDAYDVGFHSSLQVIDGRPAISHTGANYDNSHGTNNNNEKLYYVRANDANGDSWGSPMTLDANTRVLQHTSLAVINGNPAISYFDATDFDNGLKYIRATNADGTNWGVSVKVDSPKGQYSNLIVADGNPAISYSAGNLMYVRATDMNGDTWGLPVTVDSSEFFEDATMSLINGKPAIAYYAASSGKLKYVNALDASGTVWDIPTIIPAPGIAGMNNSLAMVDGGAAISYWQYQSGLRYVREAIVNLPPVVNSGGPYTVNESSVANLTATGSDPEGGPLTYDWDLDNNGSFETPGQSVDFSAASLSPGVYTVVVQVTDNGGLVATDDTTVTVEDIPTVDDFVILGIEGMWIKQNSVVYGGDVGTNVASSGPYLDSGVETSIGVGVQITNANSGVYGDSVKLKQGSQVQDVFYNDISGLGTVLGDENTPVGTPIVSSFPTIPSFSPGTVDVVVPSNDTQTLIPGSYKDLRINSSATLVLEEGVYNFNSWDIRTNANVYFDGPVEIRIADKLNTLQGAEIRPSQTSTIDASDVVIFVTGINGNNGNLGATPKAAKFGENNVVEANVYVENGTLYLKQNTVATGSFIGKWVVGGISTEFNFDSAF